MVLAPHNAECNLLCCHAESKSIGITAMGTPNTAGQNKRVLLVDDDIELLLMFETLLQANDYQTHTAANGAQALKVLRNIEVDAILCDLDMPELSGDLLYLEVGRAWPGLLKRFIFVTGNAENPLYEEFLKRTQPTVLEKPISIVRLLEQLEAVFGVPA
jgi:two-component system cell cycle sensor histidine kinase/response regulator CckA